MQRSGLHETWTNTFNKHTVPLSGVLSVYQCIDQRSLELDGEVQTMEEKGAYRAESRTPCVSTIRNGLLTFIWNPGPDLSLCGEGETVQNTFGVVIGSGFPEAVTEMGQEVVCSYRPLPSWKTGHSSQVELTPLCFSTCCKGTGNRRDWTRVTQA